MSTLEKIENGVVNGVKEIAENACEFEKVAENIAVGTYKIIEETVVDGFTTISDAFIEKYLMKEGETLEEAKERINKEQEELAAKTAARTQVNVNIPDSNEIVKKNLEASLNAGKR